MEPNSGQAGRTARANGLPDVGGAAAAAWYLSGLWLVLTLLAGDLSFSKSGLGFTVSRLSAFIIWLIGAALMAAFWRMGRLHPKLAFGKSNPWFFLAPPAALFLFMLSGVRRFDWYFFLNPRAYFWLAAAAVPAALAVAWAEKNNRDRYLYPLLLLAAQVYLAHQLMAVTGGAPIYRDDHPSFLYRFWLLPRVLPRIYFWNPFWNGGYLGTELIATGALSVGLLTLPFQLLGGLEKIYTPFLAGLFVFVIPWIAWLSLRSLGFSRLAALVGAVIAMGANRFAFINLLVYGTTPYLLTSFLLVAVWSVLFAAVRRGRLGFWRWLSLVVAVNFMMFYPPSAVILFPVLAALVFDLGRLRGKTLWFLLAAVGALLLLNGWWLIQYLTHPRVLAFIARPTHQRVPLEAARVMATLAGSIKQINPLIVVLGFAGVVWPAKKDEARWVLLPVTALLLMMAFGPFIKPQLQLKRMLTPLSFFLMVPAASLISRAGERRGWQAALFKGTAAAAALLTVLSVHGIFANRGKELIFPLTGELKEVFAWISANVPEEGRLFFGGSTVHGYGAGHVAWIQAATGKNMIAGDFYHFDPQLVDWNPLPKAFRGSRQKLMDYFKLMGVTHVISYDKEWKRMLHRRKPYRFLRAFGRREVFATGVTPGFIIGGSGNVTARLNRLEVSLDKPSEEIVLKFLWQPGLTVDAPASLHPAEAAPGVTLIGVRPNGRLAFTVSHE